MVISSAVLVSVASGSEVWYSKVKMVRNGCLSFVHPVILPTGSQNLEDFDHRLAAVDQVLQPWEIRVDSSF